MQIPFTVQVENGDIVKLHPGDKPEVFDKAPSGRLFVDGNIAVEEDSKSIKEKKYFCKWNLRCNNICDTLKETYIINLF